MDDHNVHHFWGVSPALDLLGTPGLQLPASSDQQLAILQVCPYDCRHTLATLRAWAESPSPRPALQLHVYEEHPEALARHILLLYVLLDPTLPPRERCEVFLELHGNALLRQKTADYLHAGSKLLEDAVVAATSSSSSSSSRRGAQQGADQAAAVVALFDLSCLKYRDVDDVVEVLGSYRSKKAYDMVQAWDARSRRWYAERYDSRRNVVDWDYHMRLLAAGTPGLDPALGSIIHFYHFRHWRTTGVAYELRDSSYPAPNTSLLSRAQGRTKEFKDRFGKDVGRSVAATGYWANIVDPPYTSFGISTDDPALLKQANKQFSHSSVDVAEHNLLAILAALRGQPASGTSSSSSGGGVDMFGSSTSGAHRARAARGPTDMAGLAAATGAEDAAPEEATGPAEDDSAAAAAAADGVQQLSIEDGGAAAAGPVDSSNSSTEGAGTAAPGKDAAAMCEQEAAQRAASAALDAAALQLLQSGLKITLHTGDVQKVLLGRAQFTAKFAVTTVGHRHVHLVGEETGLQGVTAPGGSILAETGKYLLLLSKDKVSVFEDKIRELSKKVGLVEQVHSSSQQQAKGKRGSSSAGGSSSSKQCLVTVLEEDGACSKDQAGQGSNASSSGWHLGWYEQKPEAHLLFKVPCT